MLLEGEAKTQGPLIREALISVDHRTTLLLACSPFGHMYISLLATYNRKVVGYLQPCPNHKMF